MLRAAASLIPVLALVGCVASSGDEGMVILNNTAAAGTTCQLTGDKSQPFLSEGIISLASPSAYLLTPLIESKITALVGQETQRTIFMKGARIDLSVQGVTVRHADNTVTSPTITLSPSKFTSLFSASLAPAGTANVAFDLVPATVIGSIAQQAAVGPTDSLHVQVVATATVFGDMGGSEITATPFQYPVTVCNDCVVVDHMACPLMVTTARPGDPCNPFQDGIVDCCRDPLTQTLICPGTM